ncbi:vWA domain-containing protein [Hyalangium rubrum]|uniref:VWA domain-containing protein n=1 Tax=Hyalangium rubrum TaxID=3103134 RepID=A0ABU5H3B5_9BACT|nr:vWA domain-containing protein [Hyalangium sp. s54d21]MDY7227865.1 vWA domain-containing protein [Hyalangium sp. s54d21]
MKARIPPRLILLFAALGGVAACESPVDRPGSTLPGRCEAEAPVIAPQKTDILFVIDNSGSMAEEQQAIATELPAFLEELRQGGGVTQDFRVGVITTSVYLRSFFNNRENYREYPNEAGLLRPVPTPSGGTGTERYIESSDPEVLEKFRRLVKQGVEGSGQETPFEAVRLAVASSLASAPLEEGGNGGFLRDGARLLVVVVTDEEDCSTLQRPPPVLLTLDTSRDLCSEQAAELTSVGDYFNIFQGLKDSTGAGREVLWATIGPVALSDKRAELVSDGAFVRNAECPTSYGPGFRHRAMSERFNSRLENLDSICKASYRDTLVAIAELAAISQSIEVVNLPDPLLARVEVTRGDGTVQTCSVAGGDLRYDPSGEGRPARLFFLGNCLRQSDDKAVEVKLLCAG